MKSIIQYIKNLFTKFNDKTKLAKTSCRCCQVNDMELLERKIKEQLEEVSKTFNK